MTDDVKYEKGKNAIQEVRSLLKCAQVSKAEKLLLRIRQEKLVPEQEEWQIHELYGALFYQLADPEGAAAAYQNAMRCDRFLRSQREHFSSLLFLLHYLPGISAEELYLQHIQYSRLFQEAELPSRASLCHKKLRIGFLSLDFLESSAARFYEPLLTGLQKEAFRLYGYSLSEQQDAFSQRMVESLCSCQFFSMKRQSLWEIAQAIRQDEIDILVDLGGHCGGGLNLMVCAMKPAPVQLSGIGYFDTTGLGAMDGLLTDEVLTPACEKKLMTEQDFLLPNAFCFRPTEEMKAFSRQEKKTDTITFGSLQNIMKLNDEVLLLWKEILCRLPDSRLRIQDTTRIDTRREVLRRRLEKADFPMDRVELCLGRDDYLADYQEVDIMLDTFPYTGGYSVATALYMGVPVISLRGNCYSRRFSSSLLTSAGRADWIADTKEEYVEKAVSLAASKELPKLQQGLRQYVSASSLMDEKAYCHAFGEACRKIWRERGDFTV